MKVLNKILALFSRGERIRAYLMLVLILLQAFFEMVGVASIMPFVLVLSNPEVVESNTYLTATYTAFGFENTASFMYFLGIIMLVALLGMISFKALVNYLLLRFVHMRSYSLSRSLVESYLCQPYEYFLNRHSADLGKSILAEAKEVVTGVFKPLLLLISGAAVCVAIMLVLFIVNPRLTLIIMLWLSLGYGSIYLLARGILNRLGARRVIANKAQFEAVQDCFGGIKEVKVTGLEGPYLKRFERSAKEFARTQAKAVIFKELPVHALHAITYGGAFVIVLFLMREPGGLQAALPTLAVFALGSQRLLPALGGLYKNLSLMRFSGPALDDLYRDMQHLSGVDTLSLKELKGHFVKTMGLRELIELDHLYFTYPGGDKQVLIDINIKIPARTTVGLVGASGSGKTTTVDIILGLLKPDGGYLKIDGTVISKENLRSWQKSIGYVPQHIYLIDDTIAANIAFGISKDKIDYECVERAARIANLHDFVINQLGKGYETLVGERGVRLSGGQRQRIGIARALYHDPEVLILDEATSALDSLTEQAVMEDVHNLGHRKTIIVIAHRLSTVRKCDTIFLLKQGRLIAQGSFETLVKENVTFLAMVNTSDIN